jgi:outer membrane biosynthesis protein TonB
MSEHERGAYTPPTEASLSFDARQPVRGASPIPFTLIISILVLLGLAAAIFVFYRSGVRQAGQPPQAVGAPVEGMKAPPPVEAQPQDPAAGLQIYKGDQAYSPGQRTVHFAPPPETPEARPQPGAPAVVVTPMAPAAPATPAPTLRPSIPAQPLPAPTPAPAVTPPPAKPAPRVETPAPKAAPAAKAPPPAPAKPAAAKPAPAAQAPAAKATGVAAVQIGAFSSQSLADKGWSDAAAIAPGPAAGKGKSVEKVEKDGHTLFRTQVTGFSSRADASAFCAKLKAAGKACFVK